MKPIDFKERNFIIAENQKGVLPLPVYYDGGGVISCWQLSPEEMAEVQRTGVIYIRNVTHGQPLQPMLITGHKAKLLPIRPENIEENPKESQTATERATQLINQTEANEKPNDNPKETQKKGLGFDGISEEMSKAIVSMIVIFKEPESKFLAVVREIQRKCKMDMVDLSQFHDMGFVFRDIFFRQNVFNGIVDYKHFEEKFIQTANRIINDQI